MAPQTDAGRQVAALPADTRVYLEPNWVGHPSVAFVDAIRTVVEACRAEGRAPGVLVRRAPEAERYLELGYRFVGLGSDSGFVFDGARHALEAVRKG